MRIRHQYDGNHHLGPTGKPLYFAMDGNEKVYGDYMLTATKSGEASSAAGAGQCDLHITAASTGVSLEFPFELQHGHPAH